MGAAWAAGLYNQPGQGRKPILTPADEALINQQVSAHVQPLKTARQALRQELNREFSHKTLQRFLKSVARIQRGVRLFRPADYMDKLECLTDLQTLAAEGRIDLF